MYFKYLLTILWSAGIFAPVFSQYSAKVTVLSEYINSLILNVNFVIRKQGLTQKSGKVPADGYLEVKGLSAGRFSLLLTSVGYADYSAEFDLSPGNPVFDFGKITLREQARLLEEVRIFAAVRAIRIKGDTTEYLAPEFRLNPNDKVENLLKRLPGISVDNAIYASSSVDLSVPGYQIDLGGYDELESRSGYYSGQGR
ncbi:hypothetical protein [Pedobacter gandavensis]|uniref:hypothetical protein n=1 Tax=Pedobacter gandavensis TaxID=2679963 RepID=UPI00292E785B|nr:hypothetical protein [Pedobacter gandavensis]